MEGQVRGWHSRAFVIDKTGTHADWRILSIPFGPRVLFTKSPTAMAPTKAARRAFSPFSSVVPSAKIWVGKKDCMAGRFDKLVGQQIRFMVTSHSTRGNQQNIP